MPRFIRTSLFTVFGLAVSILASDLVWTSRHYTGGLLPDFHELGDTSKAAPFLISTAHPKIEEPPSLPSMEKQIGLSQIRLEVSYKNFPDITACLDDTDFGSATLNLLNFRWADFAKDEDVRLCFFYVADILGSAERVEGWFRAQRMATWVITSGHSEESRLPHTILHGGFRGPPLPCTFYSTFVAPFLSGAPWRPAWDVRRDASGIRVEYFRDGRIARIEMTRGSCLN
jgi:hypothetical protein